jgi:amino acid adenylation domain-containing protein
VPLQHSFWIIGETTLAIRCAEVLLERGHVLRGLITAHPVAAEWARERGVAVVAFRDALPALTRTPYDFLLSIVNSRILGPDILATPTRGAINYHDGPLPRYAGMHSTSWAILNEETTHGVTWHGITELVDAGPIYRQRIVPIEPGDTALSLNARSYEAALDSFAELVDDMTAGRLDGREQDRSQRTYFPHLARPPAAGLLDWTRPASSLAALVRGLDFGAAYANPLGRAKVRCGSHFYLCERLRVTSRTAGASPGTIVGVDAMAIAVAAADYVVAIESLATIDGRPVSLADVTLNERLEVGGPLGATVPEVIERIGTLNEALAAHEAYWRRTLLRVRPLEVPFRLPGATRAGRFHSTPLSIPPGPLPGTDAQERVAMVVSAFVMLLSRLTLEESISLALSHPALPLEREELRQLFAPAVPMHLDAPRQRSVAEHVGLVSERLAETGARMTFARDLLARYPELRGRVPATPILVRIDPTGAPPADASAELILDIASGSGASVLHADAGALAEEDARRMARQFETLVAAMFREPSIPLGAAPIVPEAERRLLLSEWNATARPYPRQATIHGLFEEQARSAPEAIAVVSPGAELTFAELSARADCWARVLRSHGIGRDSIVGLRTERTPELVIGMLAILKAGGAYLPLDRSLPQARSQFMLDDAAVDVVLTTRRLRDELEHGARTVLCLDEPPEPRATPEDPGRDADAESLAYVIYTSGSTGTPKGVLVHHRGVVNYLSWAIAYYAATEGTGSPVHSPIAFDLTVTSLIAPLLGGRPVHLLDERLGVDALAEALRGAHDFTLVKLTPSHLELLRHQLDETEVAGRARAFVIGGENLQGPGLGYWQRHAPGTRLINEYGPTETVVGCCVYEVPAGRPLPGSVPIGRPIANTRLYVLDPQMELLPIGIAGELYIGGDGVARGYLNRPDLTDERFVPDPFVGHGRLYRTGDRVRYLPDGNLEFLGRLDGQVKVRGYRIELGEIESTLASHPAVAEAAATVWHDPVTGPHLAGYMTLNGTVEPAADELRAWCARLLPDYMVPATIQRIPTLPLTGNGKVDRAALPVPAIRLTEQVEPRTDLERRLAAIWSEVLGRPVGVTDNFFELGGHSLLAVRMISRVRDETGHAPPLSVLLTRPTIEHVAAALEGAEPSEADPMMVCVVEGTAAPPFFFLHGDFASGGFYVHTIARHLAADQALYSIRPPHPGGPASIEGMAALTLTLIRDVQSRGPYLLGGNCNGGAVAVEVARLLRLAGEDVRLLALVNTAHRNAHLAPVKRIATLTARVMRLDAERERSLFLRLRESVLRTMERQRHGALVRPGLGRALAWARIGAATLARVAGRMAGSAIGSALGRPLAGPEQRVELLRDDLGTPLDGSDEERLARYRYIDRAMRDYVAAPIDVPVTLIWWERSGAFDADPELHADDLTRGFGSLSPSVRVITVEGAHEMVPGRDIDALARAIASCIHAARTEVPEPPRGASA